MGPLVWGGVVPLGPLGQGLLDPSGIRVVGQLKQGLVSIAPKDPPLGLRSHHGCFFIFIFILFDVDFFYTLDLSHEFFFTE